jgi:hypothetical protein
MPCFYGIHFLFFVTRTVNIKIALRTEITISSETSLHIFRTTYFHVFSCYPRFSLF